MDQLWQQRSDAGLLTFEAYARLGGLEGALGQRAEEVFALQPIEVQSALPIVLRTLVTVGQGANAAACARSAPISKFPPGTPARTLIEAFLHPEARLLVADGNQVRIAHEALLSHWPAPRTKLPPIVAILNCSAAWRMARNGGGRRTGNTAAASC
jgi:hypothetical protein